MNLGKYISEIIEQRGIRKTWVADKADINYKTFVDKLNRDSITGKELLRIGKLLNISLDELKNYEE
jgi:hypothetical protein